MTTTTTPENAIASPRWKLLRRVVAIALLTVLGIGAFVPELRNLLLYAVAPRLARDGNFLRLSKNAVDVYLLGTMHGKHLSTSAYGLAHLKAVLAHLRPTVLLVEARPEEISAGRLGDGPIEMPYAALTAVSLGIAVDGIDWWQLSDLGVRRTDANRDDRIFGHLIERLPARGTVLVLVGYSHVPELEARLERDGYRGVGLTSEEKTSLFEPLDEPFVYPPGMADAIRQRIADVERQALTQPEGAAAELRALAASRRAYLREIVQVGELPH